MLSFSHNGLNARKLKAENIFTAAVETELEFVEEVEKAHLCWKNQSVICEKEKSDDERFADQSSAIELLAEQQKTSWKN